MRNSYRTLLVLILFFGTIALLGLLSLIAAPGDQITQFGSLGLGNGQFNNPDGIAVDQNGHIYVADVQNNRIQVFDNAGNYMRQFGTPGSLDGLFSFGMSRAGITLDLQGNIFVADFGNNRIQVFDNAGNFLGKIGSLGTAPGQFDTVSGVTVDDAGYIYAADSINNRVQIFASNGTFLSTFGTSGSGDGQFSWPERIAIDSRGNLYVTDSNNGRVQVFDYQGTYLRQFGTNILDLPRGIAIDINDNIYVANYGANSIAIFANDGTPLQEFNTTSDGPPSDVTLDNDGIIYYTDWNNHSVHILEALTDQGTILFREHFDPENRGTGSANYSSFSKWSVTKGSVDLFGNGLNNFLPGNGLFLDLDGTSGTAGTAGAIQTRQSFPLDTGTYRLTFSLAGNQDTSTASSPNSVIVKLGTVFEETFSRNALDPFATVDRTFQVTTRTTAPLSFEDPSIGDTFGVYLDNIILRKISDSITPTATPTATPVPGPTVDNLTVYDDTDGRTILPTFSFTIPVDGGGNPIPVEWVRLVITNGTGVDVVDKWLPYDRYCQGLVCYIALSTDWLPAGLLSGNYSWKVRTWHSSTGLTDFSPEANYVVDVDPPGLPSNVIVYTSDGRIFPLFDYDPLASWYHIVITDDDGNTWYDKWHSVDELTCDGSVCYIRIPALAGLDDSENGIPGLLNGSYALELTAWGPGGFNGGDPESATTQDFTVEIDEPELAQIPLDFAITNTDSGSPTFRWLPGENTTYQLLWIGTPTGLPDALTSTPILTYHVKWYPIDDMQCLEGVGQPCLFTPQDVFLANGTYEYWVLSWGPAGKSTSGIFLGWSQGPEFTVDADEPTPAAPLTPTGTLSKGVTQFRWEPVPGITWYNLWVGAKEGNNQYTTMYFNWHRANEIGCLDMGMCVVDPADLYLPEDDYVWYVQSYNPAWNQMDSVNYWSDPPGEFDVDRP